jgi:hypothetical protein
VQQTRERKHRVDQHGAALVDQQGNRLHHGAGPELAAQREPHGQHSERQEDVVVVADHVACHREEWRGQEGDHRGHDGRTP